MDSLIEISISFEALEDMGIQLSHSTEKYSEHHDKIRSSFFPKKNNVVNSVSYNEVIIENENKSKQILSPCDGFFICFGFGFTIEYEKSKVLFGYIAKTREEVSLGLVLYFSKPDRYVNRVANPYLKIDPFTGLFSIQDLNKHKFYLSSKSVYSNFSFSLDYIDDNACISFLFTDDYKINKGDSLLLLFENGTVLDFPFRQNPELKDQYSQRYYIVHCILYQEDIETMLTDRLCQYRINFSKGSKSSITGRVDIDLEYGTFDKDAIVAYVNYYLSVLKKLIPDYQLPFRKGIEVSSSVKYEFQGCFVYIMKDISNGYHKIGISNKPEYRERTLQSEKPTIEMLACKRFPTRKIAEAIESALHTVYAQQRVRGEWFNLDEMEVSAIIETLKS